MRHETERKERKMQAQVKEIESMEDRYLVLSEVPNEETFEEEMLLYNRIPGLLPMETGMLSGGKYHRYRITNRRSLRRALPGRKLSGAEFERLFTEIFGIIRHAKQFMLREDGFLILPETIFLDEQTGNVELIYYPEFHCPLIEQMRELSGWLINFLNTADEKAVYNGYAFHVLTHGDNCTFQSIAQVMKDTPALPEVSTWAEEPDEPVYRVTKPKRRKGALLGGSMLFLASVGAILFYVMR